MTKKHKRVVIVTSIGCLIVLLFALQAILIKDIGEITERAKGTATSISVIRTDAAGEVTEYRTEDPAKIEELFEFVEKVPVGLSGFGEPVSDKFFGDTNYLIKFYQGIGVNCYFTLDNGGGVFYGGRVYKTKTETVVADQMMQLVAGW